MCGLRAHRRDRDELRELAPPGLIHGVRLNVCDQSHRDLVAAFDPSDVNVCDQIASRPGRRL
jgi:hypothetical protein